MTEKWQMWKNSKKFRVKWKKYIYVKLNWKKDEKKLNQEKNEKKKKKTLVRFHQDKRELNKDIKSRAEFTLLTNSRRIQDGGSDSEYVLNLIKL